MTSFVVPTTLSHLGRTAPPRPPRAPFPRHMNTQPSLLRLADVMMVTLSCLTLTELSLCVRVTRPAPSVGAHVRDAACYVCWAFARAYSPVVMQPFVDQLSEGMLLTALFDREVNCRRAAAAAFQENVGRQGHENFSHGIEILTAADFFTLGNRSNAYLEISCFVAKFDKYRHAVIDHVATVKLFHWDVTIRELAALALHRLTHLEPEYMLSNVLPSLLPFTTSADLLKRHGSICAIAELVWGLAKCQSATSSAAEKGPSAVTDSGAAESSAPHPLTLPESLLAGVAEVVSNVEKERLYRGRGGELVRRAVCRLLECMALAAMPLTVKVQVRLLDSIDESIKHPGEDVQLQAVAAVRAYTRAYFPVGSAGPSARLQARIVDKYIQTLNSADVASSTRGFCLALGALPRKLISSSPETLQRVVNVLVELSKPTRKVGDEPDAETRRNALTALTEVQSAASCFLSTHRVLLGFGRTFFTCVRRVLTL